jgi:hypothetical protein
VAREGQGVSGRGVGVELGQGVLRLRRAIWRSRAASTSRISSARSCVASLKSTSSSFAKTSTATSAGRVGVRGERGPSGRECWRLGGGEARRAAPDVPRDPAERGAHHPAWPCWALGFAPRCSSGSCSGSGSLVRGLVAPLTPQSSEFLARAIHNCVLRRRMTRPPPARIFVQPLDLVRLRATSGALATPHIGAAPRTAPAHVRPRDQGARWRRRARQRARADPLPPARHRRGGAPRAAAAPTRRARRLCATATTGAR